MLQKFKIFIFRSEIPYDKPTNVIYCSKLFVFSRKFSKTVTGADRHKMAEISAPSNNIRTSLVKSAKGSTVFSNWYICVKDTGKRFKSATRIVYLNGNARHEFDFIDETKTTKENRT